jgi:hypothetical protein
MKGLAIAQLMARSSSSPTVTACSMTSSSSAFPTRKSAAPLGAAWLAQQPDLLDAAAVWDEGGIGMTDVLPAPALFISVTEKQVLWVRIVAEVRPVTVRVRLREPRRARWSKP